MPFRDVMVAHGHRRLAGLLARSVGRDALPPSLIFSGPAGSGTRDIAIAMAQALNCLSRHGVRRCRTGGAGRVRHVRGLRAYRPRRSSGRSLVEPGDNGSIRIDQIRDVSIARATGLSKVAGAS